MSARCIISTAPIAKFGATIPPTPFAAHAVSSLSTSAAERPVVPTTGEAPAATAARALCRASVGRVKSTRARGLLEWRNSARSSPRPMPPTYSRLDSSWNAATRTEPTLPRCPAMATRVGSVTYLIPAWTPVSTPAVAAATVSPAEPAADALGRRGGERCRHHLGVDALFDRLAFRRQLLDRRLAAQVEPALAVDLDRLDGDLVADVADLLDPLHAVVGELGEVDEAVLVRQHLDEGTKRHDAHDLARIDLADLDLVGQALDPVDRLPAGFLVDSRDEDATIVLDIDLGTGLLGDLADHGAALADDVADLVGVDEDRRDARRVVAHLGARTWQHRKHLVEDEESRLACLLERLGHDLVRQALDLDVHLQRGDPLARPGHLEVHVPEHVLDALDVGHHRKLAFARHQTHRDARDGGLDRHAGVHQGQRRTANRSHRSRSVGAQDRRDRADRVRPVLDWWDDS